MVTHELEDKAYTTFLIWGLNMTKVNTENFKMFEDLISKTENTYVFNDETSVNCFRLLLEVIKDMGLNPINAEDFRKGIMSLFCIEIFNMPDLENNRFIFAPNHVSDFDALILGLLHPKIRIVSKIDWTNNKKLRKFLDMHFDLYGLDRTSFRSLRGLLKDSVNYFNNSDENKHYLIFSQGTISDFNNNSLDRISSIVAKISNKTDVSIVNVFMEQVSLYNPTRIVFDKPMKLSKDDDFRKIWLEREIAMQNALIPPARLPILSYKHANNNKSGDPFFKPINFSQLTKKHRKE
jgi:hypothetical protein